ncbi:glycosyl hydrolase 115 family protein [Duganella sp. sic0402]|uniref:glycosyl hydrolase 115 family protein n=1 Tax=Duganella sp. sic0402 TaxID=2854786 RepID=UPI001C470990|nr:glycosyl hydrolase 115 family protein [Duganella sp. sic0402]MBV7537622.1 glycosyl hydrolase 115 family protein [Duganella sp. sic0402]
MRQPVFAAGALLLALLCHALPAQALGQKKLAWFDQPPADAVALARNGQAARLYVDPADHIGVLRAAGDLQADITRVSAAKPLLTKGGKPAGADVVIIGTIGKSALIDQLVAEGKLDVSSIKGKWEGWQVQTLRKPLPGVERALVIAGSDKRGTIFGIYEMSEQIGVSPWNWWADVPAAQHKTVYASASAAVSDAPVVQYRGIFLNDEAPALTDWVKQRYGGFNHQFYEKVYELILRMRGNYLWPAMWGKAFYDDDKLNGKVADDYGVVIGTSHHEPMMRAHDEWRRYGEGKPWDYNRSPDKLRDFWTQGLRTSQGQEKLITLGMRGDGDEPMSEGANVALLEGIVAGQRKIIAKEINPDVTKVPQVWALYKEVQEYYEKGMRVPDDVMLLWCDDNWGNIRRLPTMEERKRSGGAGVYYHFDYVGGPRSYKWINVTPLPKVWEQMHLAWQYQANRMWIVNVGDLKPMEVPIEFFLTYAWNPAAWPAERLPDYLKLWATREFGPEHAADIADIVAKYAKFNGRRKPEQLEPGTYSLVNYNEAQRIVEDYNAIAARAEKISAALPANKRDAFYQLVLYPVKASAVVNELYVTAGLNQLYGTQGRAATNDLATRARALFAEDAELARRYQEDISGGKWHHMMSQTHLGYTYWNQPPRNVMPPVTQMQVPKAADMGVAVEGSELAWPGRETGILSLPALDVFEQKARFLDVFNRGQQPFDYTISASEPWITLDKPSGKVSSQQRVVVNARWADAPEGVSNATLTISGAGVKTTVNVPLRKPAGAAAMKGFIETGGVVSMEAEHYTRAVAADQRTWLKIPDHGRTLSGMTTLPVDAPVDEKPRMRLEYEMQLFNAGKVDVHATLAPTQKFQPGSGLRYAISIDDEAPQIINIHADASEKAWEKTVSDGATVLTSRHQIEKPGKHTLKFWALDPGLVLQKLVVNAGGLKPSYLGPSESPRQ